MIIKGIKKEPVITEILGLPINVSDNYEPNYGEVNIIGVNPFGGIKIKVSSIISDNMLITGNIGNNLKDSIEIITSYLKTNKYIDNINYHINFNTNLFKLDGSSGSLGIAVSLVSSYKLKKIDNNISFLGSLDLYGRVLKVSRLKDKIITAYTNKINIIYLPVENKEDIKYIPSEIIDKLTLRYVNTFEELYNELFKGINS